MVRMPQRAPYKRLPSGGIPPSEKLRRERISRTMKSRVRQKLRDSLGRFTRQLFYGTSDIRSRDSDEVDYDVPFVLSPQSPGMARLDSKEAERLLTDLFGNLAFWNVLLVSSYRDILERIEEREDMEVHEALAVVREMEDTARDDGGALAPLHMEARVTVA